jgi:hypothetical protein
MTFFADRLQPFHNNPRMNSPTIGLRVASIMFGIFGLAHLIRLFSHASVTVGSHHVPMWVSVAGLIVAGLLSVWMWRLSNLSGIA